MRAAFAFLMLAACATAGSARTPAERVVGCWINRDMVAVTMRWFPDRENPGVTLGARLAYRPAGDPVSTRYSLEPSAEGWSLCELDDTRAAKVCWQVAQGEGGSLEGGRAFIDTHSERLRITVIGDGPEQTIFAGRRDGCD